MWRRSAHASILAILASTSLCVDGFFAPVAHVTIPANPSASTTTPSSSVRLGATPEKPEIGEVPSANGDEPSVVFQGSNGSKTVAAGFEKIVGSISNLNFSKILSSRGDITENIFSGPVGSRGEVWFLLQGIVIVCILLEKSIFLDFLLGPVALGVGLLFILLSVSDLGDALSPWPKPAETNRGLKTSGIYGLVRHPMYAGLLSTFLGFSVVTNSAERLLGTLCLFVVLEYKTKVEEESLLDFYLDEYEDYMRAVPGKFFPWSNDYSGSDE